MKNVQQFRSMGLNKNHQSGVVLVVGLLILLILAVIGISSAGMGVVNQKVVLNAQSRGEVFQAAETAAVYAKKKKTWINDALAFLDDPGFSGWNKYIVPVGYEHVDTEVELRANNALPYGFTLNSDSSISYIRLEIESKATRSINVKKSITLGWVRIGAG